MKIRKILALFTSVLIITMSLVALPVSPALASTSGPYNPGAAANVTGVGVVAWVNTGNITTPGTPYATATTNPANRVTNYLQGTQFNFTIPSGSIINGITVIINRLAGGVVPGITDNVVSLVKGGAITGDNKATTSAWPTSFATATYGGESDLWGTTWTAAEINAAGFGVVLSAQRQAGGGPDRLASVDTMQITVSYTIPDTTTTVDCGSGTPVVLYGGSISCVATVTPAAGTNTPGGTISWTSGGGGTFTSSTCTLSGSAGTATCSVSYEPVAVGSGSHLITAFYSGDSNFNSSSGSQAVTVNPLPVTVTADAKTKVYGEVDQALTYISSVDPLPFGDVFTGELARELGEDVGSYAINQGTLALTANYDLSYVGADMVITARPVTVTAGAQTKIYGNADPELAYQITSGSLVLGDAFSGALARVAGEDVGAYAINQGTLALGNNYYLTFVGGANLAITVRPITVTAGAQTKFYGDPDPELTFQVTSGSLAFSDAFTGALARVAGEDVGTYAINQGTLALTTNYILTFVGGADLAITVRPITVTADAKFKAYGDLDPELTYQITSGSLAFTDAFTGALTRDPGEAIGVYAILPGTLALTDNYTLTFVGNNLTITGFYIFIPVISK